MIYGNALNHAPANSQIVQQSGWFFWHLDEDRSEPALTVETRDGQIVLIDRARMPRWSIAVVIGTQLLHLTLDESGPVPRRGRKPNHTFSFTVRDSAGGPPLRQGFTLRADQLLGCAMRGEETLLLPAGSI